MTIHMREGWSLSKKGKQVVSVCRMALLGSVSGFALLSGGAAQAGCTSYSPAAGATVTCSPPATSIISVTNDDVTINLTNVWLNVSGNTGIQISSGAENLTLNLQQDARIQTDSGGSGAFYALDSGVGHTITLGDAIGNGSPRLFSDTSNTIFFNTQNNTDIRDNTVNLGTDALVYSFSDRGLSMSTQYSAVGTGAINNNIININDGHINGYASTIDLLARGGIDGNEVNLSGGSITTRTTVVQVAYNGINLRGMDLATVTGNKVTLNDGTLNAGYKGINMTSGLLVGGNTVTLGGGHVLTASLGAGVYMSSNDVIDGNAVVLNDTATINSATNGVYLRSVGTGTTSNNTVTLNGSSSINPTGGDGIVIRSSGNVRNNTVTLRGTSTIVVPTASSFGVHMHNVTGTGDNDGNSVRLEDAASISTTGSSSYTVFMDLTGDHYIALESGTSVTAGNGIAVVGGSGRSFLETGGDIASTSGVAVDLGSGNDEVKLLAGNAFTGLVDGGADTDALIFDGSGTENANFSSFETLAKTNAGTWTTQSTLSVAATTVAEGTLFVTGSLNSPLITVDAMAGLGGTGNISGEVENHGALIASANDLNITGDAFFYPGSSLLLGESAGNPNLLTVSGKLGFTTGTSLALTGNPAVDVEITVATSDALFGLFDEVTDENGNVLDAYGVKSVNAKDVVLFSLAVSEVAAQAGATTSENNMRGFMSSVLGRMDVAFRHPGDRGASMVGFGSTRLKGNASRSLMGASDFGFIEPRRHKELIPVLANYEISQASGDEPVAPAVNAKESSGRGTEIWSRGFSGLAEQDATAQSVGYEAQGGGFSAGRDGFVGDNWLIGTAIGYSAASVDLDGGAGRLELSSLYGALYASYHKDNAYINLISVYGANDHDVQRKVSDGEETAMASGVMDGWIASFRAEAAVDFDWGEKTLLRPRLSLEHVISSQDAFEDDGGGLITGLQLDEQTSNMNRGEAQVDWLRMSRTGSGLPLEVNLYAGVAFESYTDERLIHVDFVGSPEGAWASLGEDNRTFGLVGGAINMAVSDRLSTQFGYNGEIGSEFNQHNVYLGMRYSW